MAHPVVTLALVLVSLVLLWMVALINRRLRVLQDRMDSLEQGQRLFEEGLEVLGQRAAPPSSADVSEVLRDIAGADDAAAAAPAPAAAATEPSTPPDRPLA